MWGPDVTPNDITYFGALDIPLCTPAHGTAYDIAGTGKASETPMVNALKLATRAALSKRQQAGA